MARPTTPRASTDRLGPVQVLVLGFDGPDSAQSIRAELERLQKQDVVRVLDLLAVRTNEAGEIEVTQWSDLGPEEAAAFRAIVRALVSLDAGAARSLEKGHVFDEAGMRHLTEVLPHGTATIVLLEHCWAIPLRDLVARAGGIELANDWLHPLDLVAAHAEAVASGSSS